MKKSKDVLRKAVAEHQAGNMAESRRLAEEALAVQPDDADALHVLGVSCRKLDLQAEAVAALRRAIELRPQSHLYRFELGVALQQLGEFDEALAAYRRAVELKPDFQEAISNLGAALNEIGRNEEALPWFARSLELKPDCLSTHINRGNVLQAMGRFEPAIASYRRAIEIAPDNAKAHWNASMAYLRAGQFADGWREYQWRVEAGETKLDDYQQPLWRGEPLAGRTLLVHAEQGVGDEVIFASMYPELIARAGHCVFVCEPRLAPLWERSFPAATIVPHRRRSDRAPAAIARQVDYQIAAGSLGQLLRNEYGDFPLQDRYVRADERRVRQWRERFAALGPGLKIGISWRAGGKPSEQVKRKTELALWRPLFDVPGTHFVNLQYGEAADELQYARDVLGLHVHDFADADALTDLEGLAAQIMALDLVVSVGNTTVHLAGSLGQTAWGLLPVYPSWRWMHDVEQVPWYRSVHLFRQQKEGAWHDVFTLLATELYRRQGLEPPADLASRVQAAETVATGLAAPTRIPAQETVSKFVAKLQARLDEAVALHQQNRLAEAEKIYRDVLNNTPQHVDALHLLGVVCHQTKRLEQGIKCLRQAVALNDGVAKMHFHLGVALKDAGEREEAVACYRRALAIDPKFIEALLNLGAALQEAGDLPQARATYERGLAVAPQHASLHFNVGSVLRRQGAKEQAAEHFRQGLAAQPDFVEARLHLGQVLRELGRWDESLACFEEALQFELAQPAAYRGQGQVLLEQRRTDEAIACYQRALELEPSSFEALANLGRAFQEQEQYALALDCYRQALEQRPDEPQVLTNAVAAQRHLGDLAAALEGCERILRKDPQHAEAHQQRALIWLQQGDWRQGWQESEWRWKTQLGPRPRHFAQPAWRGETLAGKSLLVHAELGLAEEVMFASCLPDLADRAAKVHLACEPRLANLLARSFPTVQVHAAAQTPGWEQMLPRTDFQIAAGSLPRWLRPSPATPAREQFLYADPIRTAEWRQALEALGPGLKVGIVGDGGHKTPLGSSRAPAWDHWLPLLKTPGVHWLSLQDGPRNGELLEAAAGWGVTVHSMEADLSQDLDEMAAQLAALDLLISVEHLPVHLAGALSVPTWLMLSPGWGWRWLSAGASNPWYASVRACRTARPHAWQPLMAGLQSDLQLLAAKRAEQSCDRAPRGRTDPPHGHQPHNSQQRAPNERTAR